MTSSEDAAQNGLVYVVVADDELHILNLVASIVEERGCTAIRATNGENALHATQEYRPALVLSDVMMPRLRGDELCRLLKANPATAAIPVVLLTSLPRVNFEHACAYAYIAKPFAVEQIESVLTRVLGSKSVADD